MDELGGPAVKAASTTVRRSRPSRIFTAYAPQHRADALGEDLDEVAGTSLDKGVELDALKGMDPANIRAFASP